MFMLYAQICVCSCVQDVIYIITLLQVWYPADISARAALGLQTKKSRSDTKK